MSNRKSYYWLLGIFSLISIYFVIIIRRNESLWLDETLSDLILTMIPESSTAFFAMITKLGDTKGVAIVALLVVIWLWMKRRDYIGMAVLLLAVALGNEVNKVMKELVGRERPITAAGVESLSFPSGHAMVAVILYMLIAYLMIKNMGSSKWKWGIGIFSFILVCLIGLSRLVLRDHFPTDVLAGYSFGIVWSLLWIALYEPIHKRLTESKSN